MFSARPIFKVVFSRLPIVRSFIETRKTACPITVKGFIMQKILGFNRNVPWPVHFTSLVTGHEHIQIGYNTAPGVSLGNYIFASADSPIRIGSFCAISSNVCIGSFNHCIYDISNYESKGPIVIGEYCWIAANSVILSGVEIGDHTIVAAGAVVNSSFKDGYCILAGVPARIVKRLDKDKCIKFKPPHIYKGYKRIM